ncbi:SusC/RagA family TonB-linked outer membrane protein [Parapedobacter tibetensis]|uniref:SusC/RagA family TonB-linked outer membrane protein n=1 Tax=Parapedobacter tibetensis TaxID=2972951 RepID=UPI00214DC57B|nr:SusC/RagA family TonB-linked outer membrane protein [Parapedobacter tibetensis]
MKFKCSYKLPYHLWKQGGAVLLTVICIQVSANAYTRTYPVTGALPETRQMTVHGVVVDIHRNPLTGVTVTEKGTNNVTTTNTRGQFSLTVPHDSAMLHIHYIGHASLDVRASDAGDIILEVERSVLDEVVVIGYGESTRGELTGSVSKVEGKTIVQQPIQNPVMALQGRVAGVYISTTSGNLGALTHVRIRGDNTVLSSPHPLYIIDGVPLPSTSINNYDVGGAAGWISPFINLNAADIESVEVLKDADATAIYGSRGANGVILITTKKGKAGPTRVSADIYRGYQRAVNKLELLNTQEYIQMRRDAFAADGIAPSDITAIDIVEWGEERYTDLQDLLFGDTESITDAQLNVQGGTNHTTFMLGLGFRDENGVLMGKNNQKKGTARLNVNHRSSDNRFTTSATLAYTLMKMASIGADAFEYAWLAPNIPLLDEETGLPYYGPSGSSNTQSPLQYTYTDTDLKNYQFVGSGTIGYQVLDNLQVKLDGAFTRLDYNGIGRYRSGYIDNIWATADKNYAYFSTNYQYTYNIEPQINYNVSFGKNKFAVLTGSTFQHTISGGQFIEGQDFPSELLMNDLGSASRISNYNNSYNEYKFHSLFGRVTYNFDDTYFLNATFRRDGSSRFAPDRRFGNFWALGIAWILSNEQLVKDNLSFVSFAKLRSSYGLTGNDGIGNYAYMETFGAANHPYNFTPGLYADRLGNPQFRWERTNKFEVALELNLFNNRITTTTAFFNHSGSNQLVTYPTALQTGWSSYVANLDGAKTRNRGVEFEFTTHNIKTTDFNWQTTFNITTYKNTLVAFPNLSATVYANRYEVGKSLNTYKRFEFDHIDPETGMPLVVDQNGDGMITWLDDRISYGSSDPAYYGGLGNTFRYKGFELDVFFQFVKRPYANGYINDSNSSQPGIIFNVPKFLLEGIWRKPGDQASRPRLSTQNSGDFGVAYDRYGNSTAAIEDASFMRLKNLSLSYTVPAQFAKKLKLDNLRVYLLGQNLLTITGYKGYDPETPGFYTPPLKVFTFGLQVTL